MFVAVASKSAWHAVGQQVASLLAFVNKTYSEARAGPAGLPTGRRSRWWSSTCYPTAATWTG